MDYLSLSNSLMTFWRDSSEKVEEICKREAIGLSLPIFYNWAKTALPSSVGVKFCNLSTINSKALTTPGPCSCLLLKAALSLSLAASRSVALEAKISSWDSKFEIWVLSWPISLVRISISPSASSLIFSLVAMFSESLLMVSSHSASYWLCLLRDYCFWATKSSLISERSLAMSESGAEFLICKAIVSKSFFPKELS